MAALMSDPALPPPGSRYPDQADSNQLREYLAVLQARKWSILAIAVVAVLAAMFFSFRQTPIYESEAQVLVNPIQTSLLSAPPNLDTERTVAGSLGVAELVSKQLQGAQDPEELLGDLSVEVATNSEVLIIRYSDPSPLEAQRRTQAFAEAYLEFRRQKALETVVAVAEATEQQIHQVRGRLRNLNRQIAATQDPAELANLQTQASQLTARLAVLEQEKSEVVPSSQAPVGDIIAEATVPASPASPNYLLNGALALLAGLALGVGFAFLRERLDDRLRGQADMEAGAGAPVLAVIPRVATWKKGDETPLVTVTEPRSGAAEAYRTLRTSLLFAASERGARTVLVTSPHPGEGKTVTVANLGLVLGQAGRRVLMLSADLRKPRLHRFFRAPNKSGLTRLLMGEDGFREAVLSVGVNQLRLVPSGPVPKNPAELLGSHAMGQLLARFREDFDVVIIDGPPVLNVADTITLAPFVDAVVLVADAERTSRGALSHARKQLEQVRAEVIGAVLNNLDPAKARTYPYDYRYYYRYGYDYHPDREAPRRRGRGGQDAFVPAGSEAGTAPQPEDVVPTGAAPQPPPPPQPPLPPQLPPPRQPQTGWNPLSPPAIEDETLSEMGRSMRSFEDLTKEPPPPEVDGAKGPSLEDDYDEIARAIGIFEEAEDYPRRRGETDRGS
jgi:capsular exopolysaccharide synthesis family protein